VVNIQEKFKL